MHVIAVVHFVFVRDYSMADLQLEDLSDLLADLQLKDLSDLLVRY